MHLTVIVYCVLGAMVTAPWGFGSEKTVVAPMILIDVIERGALPELVKVTLSVPAARNSRLVGEAVTAGAAA